jgi:hypothetical protein
MSLYSYILSWYKDLLIYCEHICVFSGVLYFISSTVNPILYNVLSRKYRHAFKRTICRCCINIDSFPTIYKLKAKFINTAGETPSSPSAMRYLCPQKPVRMATFYNIEQNKREPPVKVIIGFQASTRDTKVKTSTAAASSSSTHAHSDGRLHYICRHKNCTSRRQRGYCENDLQVPATAGNNVSYPDIETYKKHMNSHERRHRAHMLSTFDSSFTNSDKSKDRDATMVL